MLDKLTRDPSSITAADMRVALDAGVSRQALIDMMYVGYLFAVYTRLADALGWELPPEDAVEGSAKRLLTRGYSA